RRQQEAADAELAAKIDGQRAAATAEGASTEQILDFAEGVSVAFESGAVGRGKVSADLAGEAEALLAAQPPSIDVAIVAGRLLAATGRSEEAATRWLEALAAGAPLEVFDAIVSLPRGSVADQAVLQGCAMIRPQIDETGVPSFVQLCLERANGDAAKLAWKGVDRDLAAYEAELRRLEAEAAAQAAAQAEVSARMSLYATASVFAAGDCRFNDCAKDGWETALPSGGAAVTNCRFNDCLKEGWETSFPDGNSAVTNCRFNDCFKDGWETSLPDGSSAVTYCRFNDCMKDGWETSLPDGGSVVCSCRFNDCLKDGTECN
ncbi:MAG: right-handed parallel beta-helix repeat-containing protein, partial [Myxococcales bacterium]|nr:right-handed parallel beta-helix repeat-containing protein [Myxococcales bacterium]